MNADRLPPRPSHVTSPTRRISFTLGGKALQGVEGDTVASALYANGVRTFTRSFKYHRPRGLLCVSGSCPNCLMNVDGVPNVRTCAEPLRKDMSVRHQNAWPSLKHDFLSVFDRLDKFSLPSASTTNSSSAPGSSGVWSHLGFDALPAWASST